MRTQERYTTRPVQEFSEGRTHFPASDALFSLTSFSPLSSLIFYSKALNIFVDFLLQGCKLILEDRDKIFIFQEDVIILVLFLKTLMIKNVFLTAFNEKIQSFQYTAECALFLHFHIKQKSIILPNLLHSARRHYLIIYLS